jgi:methionine-rich copper-binding protein CopC
MKMVSRTGVSGVKIYPNPFMQQVSIDISRQTKTTNITIKLTNTNGAVLRTQKNQVLQGSGYSVTLTGLQSLSRGIYYLSMEDEDGTMLMKKKLLKN